MSNPYKRIVKQENFMLKKRTILPLIPFVFLLLFSLQAKAQRRSKKKKKEVTLQQPSDVIPPYNIDVNRRILHENLDKEQLLLLKSDGIKDSFLTIYEDQRINESITDAVIRKVDRLQYEIETNKNLSGREKIYYLTGLIDILKFVKTGWKKKEIEASYLPQIIFTYKKLIEANAQQQPLAPLIEYLPYDVANTALMSKIFKENPGYDDVLKLLTLSVSQRFPEKTMGMLKNYPDAPFADSLIKLVARKAPQSLYDYAQANNKLSYRIQNIEDDRLVATIVGLARDDNKNGQYYFPFLDNIVNGKLTTKAIDAVKDDPAKYFSLLVKTQIEYAARALNGDTAVGMKELKKRMEMKAKDEFVAKMNGLHNSGPSIRFACLKPLTAEEIYYVVVLTDGLIYTSSYTGAYDIMMGKAKNKGDELLKKVNFDHYRKFISQAAAYNKLKNFLGSFGNKADAEDLMRSFVGYLEKSPGLEDGVDVADSYASLYETLPSLATDMLDNVKKNLDRNVVQFNKRGVAIYNILYKLFLSADSANKINLTKDLGVPPVYNIPYSDLTNEKGEVVVQVFFYGDQDGRNIFNGFVNMFGGGNWKVDNTSKLWVVIKSIKGKPVSIYANRALDENKGLDDEAQRALGAYLEKNNLQPSVTIHRGHSYYANSTIDYMANSSKIVFMGSCGGFNLIDSILKKCDDAHIIASKQIGKTSVNKPFFSLLTEKLRTGKDIDWIPFWKEFKQRANVAGFEDYIPPYKNLGAIFIKAYKKETGDEDL